MPSAESGKLQKAYIYDEDAKQTVVECLFNPAEYTFTKTNNWKSEDIVGGNVELMDFQGGGAMTLTLSLFFDTYSASDPKMLDGGKPKDVREFTEKVLNLMNVDPKLKDHSAHTGRPPRVSFRWGNTWSFKSVITNITQRFTMFLPDGRPVRATLDVTFRQVESQSTTRRQNPTSFAEVQKIRVVGPGETIDSIAYQEYGDSARWRKIADYNELDDPLKLRPGQRLAIPEV